MNTWCVIIVPYYISEGNRSVSQHRLLEPEDINVTKLIDQTKMYAESGMIDSTDNMVDDRVFVFHPMNDSVVLPGHNHLFFNIFLSMFHLFIVISNHYHNAL